MRALRNNWAPVRLVDRSARGLGLCGWPHQDLVEGHAARAGDGERDDLGDVLSGDGQLLIHLLRRLPDLGVGDVVGQFGRHGTGLDERVFGMNRVPVTFPHYGAEEGGYAVLLIDPRSGIAIGLHHHEANPGQPFRESQTGLDHISFGVADRASLDAWASWLDELGIEHSGVIDTDKPVPYSVVVFRDPDNIQLELIHMAS